MQVVLQKGWPKTLAIRNAEGLEIRQGVRSHDRVSISGQAFVNLPKSVRSRNRMLANAAGTTGIGKGAPVSLPNSENLLKFRLSSK
jgi:hypothetical protein